MHALKKRAKVAAAFAINRSGLRLAIQAGQRLRAGGRRVVVLGYHRVTDDFERERHLGIESCLISQQTFKQHVQWLSSRFELATMSRAVEVLQGRASAERDVAAITFDDGYADVLEHALPVLQALRAPATLYVSSAVVEREGFFPHDRLYALLRRHEQSAAMRLRTPPFTSALLDRPWHGTPKTAKQWLHDLLQERSPDEIERICDELTFAAENAVPKLPSSMKALGWAGVRALRDGGFEIGAHTTSHAVLANVPVELAEQDLIASKAAIERAIESPVKHFAYCNGYYNDDFIDALKRAGYTSAVTTEDRINRIGSDPFRIARRVVWEGTARGSSHTSPNLLACQLDGTWSALGFDASESGRRPSAPAFREPLRRLA